MNLQEYFDGLESELKQHRDFSSADVSRDKPTRIYFYFDTRQIQYEARLGDMVLAAVQFRYKTGKTLFDALKQRTDEIDDRFGSALEWYFENKTNARISVSRNRSAKRAELSQSELTEIKDWHIKHLLKLKAVFAPEIERILRQFSNF